MGNEEKGPRYLGAAQTTPPKPPLPAQPPRAPARLFSQAEVAELLGCTKKHVQRLSALGQLHRIKIGKRRVGYHPDNIGEFLARGYVHRAASETVA